jgi:hypothetical protein
MGRPRAVLLVAMVGLAAVVEAAWLAPAALVDARLAQVTANTVRLLDVQGTIWRGRGTLAAAASRVPIAWDLAFWPLLQGVARVRLTPRDGAPTPRGTLAIRSEGVAFSDVDVTIPAPMLAALAGQAATARIAGEIRAQAEALDLTSRSSHGNATLVWRAARVTGLPGLPSLDLGNLQSLVTARGDRVAGPVTNEGGDVAVRGEWSIRAGEGLVLALRVTPRRSGDTELARALAAVATPDGGDFRVEWRMPLQ